MLPNDALANLAYLHGEPGLNGDFRCKLEDFIVEEILGFEPSGEGEHVCLYIEKRDANTPDIAKMIAQLAGARNRDVSYCGMKDRHGITRQWFSVAVPVKTHIDFSQLNNDKLMVVKQVRHLKKLRSGSHKANRFAIVVRNISDMAAFKAKLPLIKQGVPNYFGEQRFGRNGNNLKMAERMFAGENIQDRKLRGLVISAARSYLFNIQLSERIKADLYFNPLDGDIFRLAGSRSFFTADVDADIVRRLAEKDLQIALTLPGEGQLSQADAAQFEQQTLAHYQAWQQGLAALRVAADCRPLALLPKALVVTELDLTTVSLTFELPTGSFATAILRQWLNVKDCSKQQGQ